MPSFRLGVIVGGALGYVLGAHAGRQRYEQIAAAGRSVARSRPAQQLGTEVRGIADRGRDLIGEKATSGVARVTSVVRNAVSGDDEPAA